MEDETDGEQEKSSKYYSLPRVWAPHLWLLTILFVYVLCGAAMFHILEGRRNGDGSVDTKVSLTNTVNRLWEENKKLDGIGEEEWKKRTQAILTDIQPDKMSWTFSQSFLYSFASLARIGSAVQPATFSGRLLTLIYSFFGIPLCWMTLEDLSKLIISQTSRVVAKQFRKKNSLHLFGWSFTLDSRDRLNFFLSLTAVWTTLVLLVSVLYQILCGGSIFGNVYSAFLILLGIGPASLQATEQCFNFGILSVIPAHVITIGAPVAWIIISTLSDLLSVEYIRKMHWVEKKFTQNRD